MKRVTTFVLAVLMALSCALAVPAWAATDASKTICSSYADLRPGSKSGQLKVDYSVLGNIPGTSLGVKTIKLYKDTGEHVATIKGTVSNGLVIENDGFHTGTYVYNGAESGEYYYAEVTVFVTTTTDSDSYTQTTPTVKAP